MSDINIKINVVSKAAEASVSGLARDAKSAEKGFKGLNVQIKQGSKFLSSFAGNLAAIGVSKAIGALANGFSALSGAVFDSTIQLEQISTQFEVLTGSAANANAILKDIEKFAARTPFEFEDVARAGQRLLSFGFTIDETKDNLQDLGDVSAAFGQDLGEVSLIFGQVAAAGKLTGERLLQFQERAIPIGPALAKSMGVAESSIKDLVSEGKVSFAEFEKAFKSLNEEGGAAFGGIEKQSQTLGGRISTLRGEFKFFAANIGGSVAPALKAGTTAVTEFLRRFGESKELQQFLKFVSDSIPSAIQFLGNAVIKAVQIFNFFRITINNLDIVIAAVTAQSLSAAESVLNLAIAVKSLVGADTSGLEATRNQVVLLKEAAEETGTEISEANLEIEKSQRQLEQVIRKETGLIIESYKKEKEAAEEKANATVDADAKQTRAAANEAKKRLAIIQKERADKIALLEGQRVLDDELAVAEEEAAILKSGAVTERQALELQILADQKATARENELEAEQRHTLSVAEFEKLRTKNKLAQVKRQNAIDKAQNKLEENERKQKLQRQATFFQSLTTIAAFGNAKLFKIAKAAQTANATVDGIAAVQKAASAAPFPANIPGIVIETARAVTSVAQIRAQSPKFQEGGIVPGGSFSGDNVLARVNSGEMILNRQQQANLFNQANGGSGGGQVIEVTSIVQVDETEIGRAVSRQVANGLELGEGGV